MLLLANPLTFYELQFDPLNKLIGLTNYAVLVYKEQNKNIYEANNTILFA